MAFLADDHREARAWPAYCFTSRLLRPLMAAPPFRWPSSGSWLATSLQSFLMKAAWTSRWTMCLSVSP
eukprot:4564221-Pyramimonas_sp.AAC.1